MWEITCSLHNNFQLSEIVWEMRNFKKFDCLVFCSIIATRPSDKSTVTATRPVWLCHSSGTIGRWFWRPLQSITWANECWLRPMSSYSIAGPQWVEKNKFNHLSHYITFSNFSSFPVCRNSSIFLPILSPTPAWKQKYVHSDKKKSINNTQTIIIWLLYFNNHNYQLNLHRFSSATQLYDTVKGNSLVGNKTTC